MDNMFNNMDNLTMHYFGGIHFVCGGCLANYPNYITIRFKDYYGVQYSQDGEFKVGINDTYKRKVAGPWALITRPGPLFRYGVTPGGQRLHAFVCFKGPRVKAYIKSGLLPLNPHDPLIRITRPERFLETLRQLVVLINPLTAANYSRAAHMLEDLLLQLHEQPSAGGIFPEYLRAEFMKLVSHINETPEQGWDFKAEAKKMSISYPHFRRLFCRHSGAAPGHFLILARLRQAANRLISTNLQMKILAEQCGFGDNLYFSRLFKKYYHCPPLRYREEFRR